MEFEKPIIRITLYGRENVVTTTPQFVEPALNNDDIPCENKKNCEHT